MHQNAVICPSNKNIPFNLFLPNGTSVIKSTKNLLPYSTVLKAFFVPILLLNSTFIKKKIIIFKNNF